MLWIIPAWILSCIATFWLGYSINSLKRKIAIVENKLDNKVDKYVKPEEPRSELLDPDDEVAEAMYQHKVMMDKLNGK